jgi:nucleotide-binding universal stress UspA family protein
MIRNLLVGLDGSPYGDAAVELGVRWARQTHAALCGLTVVDELAICGSLPGRGSRYPHLLREAGLLAKARCRTDQVLERFTARCAEAGVPYHLLHEVGAPAECILSQAANFDLTLLGQRTHFEYGTEDIPDQTLGAVLHNSPRPVVAVPLRVPESGPVVVAYNGSPAAGRALEAFQQSGLAKWEPVYVVSVDRNKETADRHATEGALFLSHRGIAAQARPEVTAGLPASALLQQVKELGAAMLVLGAYGRSNVWSFIFGSTTQAILEESDAVLFLRP